jgi:regulator of sigma E protease
MNGIGLLIYLAILIVSVVLHEFAHYITARAQGVKVHAFSVGMGPIIARKKWKGTEWRLSLLPIGGYVEIDGMVADAQPDGKLERPKHGFSALSTRGKIAILFAGPLSNFLLAVGLLTAVYTTQGVQSVQVFNNRAEIYEIRGDGARNAGLQVGDVVTRINGQILPENETVDDAPRPGYRRVQDALQRGGLQTFTVERGSQTLELSFTYTPAPGKLFGISYGPERKESVRRLSGVGEAALEATRFAVTSIPAAVQGFVSAVSRVFIAPISENTGVVGPVTSSNIAGQLAQNAGIWGVLQFALLINLSLAILNLLPIPALDGGRILVALIERLRGKPFLPEQEGLINFLGFAFLMLFMVAVLFRDVIGAFLRQ